MNLNTCSFSRSADFTSRRRQDDTIEIDQDSRATANRHPVNNNYCLNDAPLESRKTDACSYRKRSSDCLFGGDYDEEQETEDLGRFLSRYLCKGDPQKGFVDKGSPSTGIRHEESSAAGITSMIDPIPIGRTAELQIKIEAQAERVRRSIFGTPPPPSAQHKEGEGCVIVTPGSSVNGPAKRRRTFHSDMSGSNGRKIFRFGNSNSSIVRDQCSTSYHSSDNDGSCRSSYMFDDTSSFASCFSPCADELLLPSVSTSTSCHSPLASSTMEFCQHHRGGAASVSSSCSKRGSIRDLIAPMSALLSDVQRNQSGKHGGLTLNAGSPGHTIVVTKNDVVCGSGAITDSLIGNRRYRILIDLHARAYAKAGANGDPEGRKAVARTVVGTVRGSSPPGRFLRLDVDSGLWREVSDDEEEDGNGAVARAERALQEEAGRVRGNGGAGANEANDVHRRSSESSAMVLRCGRALAA